MKSIFSKKWVGQAIQRKNTTPSVRVHQYFVFTEIELFSLVICIVLDVIEYAAVVLMMPLIGDMFDVFGILVCILMFRWIGLISFVELLPGADVLPVFIITWLIWYFIKKERGSGKKVKMPLK
jgi:hypothetical protein